MDTLCPHGLGLAWVPLDTFLVASYRSPGWSPSPGGAAIISHSIVA